MSERPSSLYFGDEHAEVSAKKPRLFCFGHAGATANAFGQWRRDEQFFNLVPVRLPGRPPRFGEQVITDMDRLVNELTTAMDPLLDRPFALFGHSAGGSVAYELACSLLDQCQTSPVFVAISACRPPSSEVVRENIGHLPEDEFLSALSVLGGVSPEFLENAELRALMVPYLRADITLIEQSRIAENSAVSLPIVAFAGSDDPYIDLEELHQWHRHSSVDFRVHEVTGDHFFPYEQHERVSSLLRQAFSDYYGHALIRTVLDIGD